MTSVFKLYARRDLELYELTPVHLRNKVVPVTLVKASRCVQMVINKKNAVYTFLAQLHLFADIARHASNSDLYFDLSRFR